MKSLFPIFQKNPDLVYIDNAATTQKPLNVIDTITNYYSTYNANVHRGLYPLSERATNEYENTRKKVAEFINASPEEIIFTSGTTDSLNLLASSLARSRMLSSTPSILLSELEHHSNLLPWQQLDNSSVSYIKLESDFSLGNIESYSGDLSLSWLNQYKKSYDQNPDLVALTLTSNVTGTKLDTKKLHEFSTKSLIVLDAAQAIAHERIDVKKLNVDFLAFSGHKMYGPTGIGVLYGRKKLLEQMQPSRFGGGMINEVNKKSSTWAELSEKFEAGTPNIAGAIGLGTAIDFIGEVGFDSIKAWESELRSYCLAKLAEIKGVSVYHPKLDTDAAAVISFSVNGIHPHDLADFLGKKNICIRAGHHCTQILHREVFKLPATSRISFGVYNTLEDIDKFIDGVREAMKVYRH